MIDITSQLQLSFVLTQFAIHKAFTVITIDTTFTIVAILLGATIGKYNARNFSLELTVGGVATLFIWRFEKIFFHSSLGDFLTFLQSPNFIVYID